MESKEEQIAARRRQLRVLAINLVRRLEQLPNDPSDVQAVRAVPLWELEDERELEKFAQAVGPAEGEMAGRIRYELSRLRDMIATLDVGGTFDANSWFIALSAAGKCLTPQPTPQVLRIV